MNVFGHPKWNKSGKALKILGRCIPLEEVKEPTDINWLNQPVLTTRIFRNRVLGGIMLSIFLILLIMGANNVGEKSSQFTRRFPQSEICNDLKTNYASVQKFKEAAEIDKPHALNYFGRGSYACYCQIESSSKDAKDDSHLCNVYFKDKFF